MLVGLVVVVPLLLARGVPADLGADDLFWLAASGAANVAGLLLVYEALRLGKVSIVAPITSGEGAVAAVLAVAAGESLGVGSAVLLMVIVAGVVLASRAPDDEGTTEPLRATLFACGAALLFGASLFATARVSEALPIVWALLPARLLGVAALTLPSIATGTLRFSRRSAPLLLISGLCELGGIASYAAGSRHGIAVSAVLGSQFAALSAVAAFFLFRERLTRLQVGGIATIAVSVAVLSALQA
jgi:drug/metabolite transporter (DMT)-like permease